MPLPSQLAVIKTPEEIIGLSTVPPTFDIVPVHEITDISRLKIGVELVEVARSLRDTSQFRRVSKFIGHVSHSAWQGTLDAAQRAGAQFSERVQSINTPGEVIDVISLGYYLLLAGAESAE